MQRNTFRVRPLYGTLFGIELTNTASAVVIDATSNDWKALDGTELPDSVVPALIWDHHDDAEESLVRFVPTL